MTINYHTEKTGMRSDESPKNLKQALKIINEELNRNPGKFTHIVIYNSRGKQLYLTHCSKRKETK